MPPTPFPAGKTIDELNIDTERKFVIVNQNSGGDLYKVGEVVEFKEYATRGRESVYAWFGQQEKDRDFLSFSSLAYYEPTEQEEWEPKVGDEVAIKGDIVQITKAGSIHISTGDRIIYSVPPQALKFLSRPPAPRKVTMKEVNEKFGETVEIVD